MFLFINDPRTRLVTCILDQRESIQTDYYLFTDEAIAWMRDDP